MQYMKALPHEDDGDSDGDFVPVPLPYLWEVPYSDGSYEPPNVSPCQSERLRDVENIGTRTKLVIGDGVYHIDNGANKHGGLLACEEGRALLAKLACQVRGKVKQPETLQCLLIL